MARFPFAGGSYLAPMALQDVQMSMNWYPEISKNPESKEPVAMLGTPGLNAVLSLPTSPVRGMWALPGGQSAIVVAGNTAYLIAHSSVQGWIQATLGSLATATGPVNIRDNARGGIAVIVDGANGYVVNIAARTLAQITDPAWLGSTNIAFIDGWLVFNQPGTQTFYTSPLYWNGTDPIDATYFALKDAMSDNLVTLFEDKRELWLIGERATEVWYDAGNPTFPFSRIPGITMQHGCAAPQSITRVGNSLAWIGRDEQGTAYIIRAEGYVMQPVLNHGIDHVMAQMPIISDAIGYAYQEDGHLFYVLSFPTADQTWVLDLTTGLWHQRGSFNSATGAFHRHASNCYAVIDGINVVGDYASGNLYQMSRNYYTDNGAPLVSLRRTCHIWDHDNRERVFHAQLQLEFTPGSGIVSGQGSNPQAVLRWSDDGGYTWSNEHWASLGRQGQTKNRVIWRRLGYARDRVYEVKVSDPVSRDVIGASLIEV